MQLSTSSDTLSNERCLRCSSWSISRCPFFFFQAEDGIRDLTVTGVQTCALPISSEEYKATGTAYPPPGWSLCITSVPTAQYRASERRKLYSVTFGIFSRFQDFPEIGRASCRERV